MKKVFFFFILCCASNVFSLFSSSSQPFDYHRLLVAYNRRIGKEIVQMHDDDVGISNFYFEKVENGNFLINIKLPVEACTITITVPDRLYRVFFAHPSYYNQHEALLGCIGTVHLCTDIASNTWQTIAKIMPDPADRSSRRAKSLCLCGRKSRYVIEASDGYAEEYEVITRDSFKSVLQCALATKQAQLFFTIHDWKPFVIECGDSLVTCSFASFWLTHPLVVQREKRWRNRMMLFLRRHYEANKKYFYSGNYSFQQLVGLD